MVKSKNNKSKKLNKRVLIVGGIIIALVILSVVLFILFSNKDKSVDDIKVSELNYVEVLVEADEAKAAKLIKNNLVRITNTIDDKTEIVGTGFFTKDGYLITNSHVVDIYGDVSIEYPDGNKSKAYLYSNSVEHDIALLKVEDVPVKALSFGNSAKMEVTNSVLAAGFIYNFAGEATVSKGILSARRDVDGFTYLQTDVAIDTGASGGPLFNDKAEVVGLNTFVTENRTFALSISAETVNLVVSALLKEPTVQYLTDKRPVNPINKILVEVNYTEDEDYCLYDDDDLIKKSKKEHEDDLEELEKDEDVVISTNDNTNKSEYKCEPGFMLIGKNCFKQDTYEATPMYEDCPSGYEVYQDTHCRKTLKKNFEYKYTCTDSRYKVNKDKKCEYEGYVMDGSKNFDYRLGSCPKGEKCYEYAADFGDFYSAPTCKNDIPNGAPYIWEDEELVEENVKHFYRGIYNYIQTKLKDVNGLVYYKNLDINDKNAAYKGCYEKTVQLGKTKVYIMKRIDGIRNSACPEGTLKGVNNSNGFGGYACLLKDKPSMFYYNITCTNIDAKVIQDKPKSEPYCAVYKKTYLNPLVDKYCKDSTYWLNDDMSSCITYDLIVRKRSFKCENGGKLNGETCYIDINVPAKKK